MKTSLFSRNTTLLFLLFISSFTVKTTLAQCPVTAYASPSSIYCGQTVALSAVADGCKPLNNNFNSALSVPIGKLLMELLFKMEPELILVSDLLLRRSL